MTGPIDALADRESGTVQLQRLVEFPLMPSHEAELVGRGCDVRMIGTERRLEDIDRVLEPRRRLVEVSLVLVGQREREQ